MNDVNLYKDKALGDEGGCSLLLEESRGDLPQDEGHLSRICDTWDRVSPSSRGGRGWVVVN